MAIARWRIRRFVAAEAVLFDCEMIRNEAAVNKEFATTDADVHIAMAIRSLADESRTLSLMSRYESRLQRVHDKGYTALRDLQKSRVSPPPPPNPDPPAHNPSVSAGEIPVDHKIWRNEPTAPLALRPIFTSAPRWGRSPTSPTCPVRIMIHEMPPNPRLTNCDTRHLCFLSCLFADTPSNPTPESWFSLRSLRDKVLFWTCRALDTKTT
jgi:hypothetical protein